MNVRTQRLQAGTVAGISAGLLSTGAWSALNVVMKHNKGQAFQLAGWRAFTTALIGVCLLMTLPFAVRFFPGEAPAPGVMTWIWIE
jgi:hypothetical protein